MRIAILAHGLRAAGGLSVGINIISALADVRPEHDYLIVMPDMKEYLTVSMPPNVEVLLYRSSSLFKRLRFDLLEMPSEVAAFKPDLVWGLGNLGLTNPPKSQAILLHKPQMVYPARHSPSETLRRRFGNRLIQQQLTRSLTKTQLVFCQTNVMRSRFIQTFNYPGKVELLPNAVSIHVQETNNLPRPPKLDPISRRLKLFVLTRYYAHKNLELIIDCFIQYRKELADVACVLTIASDQHPRASHLLSRIRKNHLEDAIVNVGPVEQCNIAAFYTHTDALLLPTLLESFSGTYLEAMSFNKPILTSKLDFAEEICGDAAIYFDPWNPESLKDAILLFQNDEKLRNRTITVGNLRKQKKERTWKNIVNTAMRALEETVSLEH